MKETIFTKIASREIPAYIVDENEKFMAFLDIKPAANGQTLVIPKQWKNSYVFNNEDEFVQEFMIYVKKIAKLLDKKLGSERCILMFEGYGVDHLHAKLYPSFAYNGESLNPNKTTDLTEEIAKKILDKLGS